MAGKRRPPAKQPREYVRHTKMPAWGVGVLVETGHQQRTYLFADGQRRTFREEFISKFFEPAQPPEEEDQLRLDRGLRSGAIATPKAINVDLEAQIKENPDDDGPFLVYADWLINRDDPRGELIAVQRRLQEAPGDKAALKAEAALLDKLGPYLVPPLLWQMMVLPRRKTDRPGTHCEVTWRLGFLDRVRITRRSDESPQLADIVPELLRHPSAQFLRGLTIGPLGTARSFDYRPVVSAIASAKPAMLEELVVGDYNDSHCSLDFVTIGNASPLLAAVPSLKRLKIRAGTTRFDSVVKHKQLRELWVTSAYPPQRTIDHLLSGQLPMLESLDLVCTGLALSNTDADRLASHPGLPRLARLTLRNTQRTSVILNALVGRPLLGNLEELDLRDGDLTDSAADVLVNRQQHVRHLSKLYLAGNQISESKLAAIAKICRGAQLDEQRADAPATPPEPVVPTRTPGALDPAQALARAPDAASAKAARKLADPAKWLELGRDGERLWGEFEGSDFYYVLASLRGTRMGCSCPSEKDPCKHSLALLLLAAEHVIPERKIPDAVVRNTQSRTRWYEL